MAKTKLLSTVSAFILVLTLGACSESEDDSSIDDQEDNEELESSELEEQEVYQVIEEDIETVLVQLLNFGVDTSSWRGYSYTNLIDESVNYGLGLVPWETIQENILVAKSSEGKLTALEEYFILIDEIIQDDYSSYGYYDGEYTYYNNYGEKSITYSPNASKETFTSYAESVIHYCVEEYTDFIGLTSIMPLLGYSFSGFISESNLGNTKISVRMDAEYTYTDEEESMDVSGYQFLEVTYDQDGNFINLDYTVYEYEYYSGVEYVITQDLHVTDYLEEEVREPSWLSEFK